MSTRLGTASFGQPLRLHPFRSGKTAGLGEGAMACTALRSASTCCRAGAVPARHVCSRTSAQCWPVVQALHPLKTQLPSVADQKCEGVRAFTHCCARKLLTQAYLVLLHTLGSHTGKQLLSIPSATLTHLYQDRFFKVCQREVVNRDDVCCCQILAPSAARHTSDSTTWYHSDKSCRPWRQLQPRWEAYRRAYTTNSCSCCRLNSSL